VKRVPNGRRSAGVFGQRGVSKEERTVGPSKALASFSCVSFVVDGGRQTQIFASRCNYCIRRLVLSSRKVINQSIWASQVESNRRLVDMHFQ
jgi:hypothetical protein